MDQLDRNRELARASVEAGADLGRERDAHRAHVLAAQIEQVMGGALDQPGSARDRGEGRLDVAQLVPDPGLDRCWDDHGHRPSDAESMFKDS